MGFVKGKRERTDSNASMKGRRGSRGGEATSAGKAGEAALPREFK